MPMLIFLAILLVLAGPVAVLLCIILFGKLRVLKHAVDSLARRPQTHQRPQSAPEQRAVETVKTPVEQAPAPVEPPVKPPAPVVTKG